jgi:hypothetical protein
VVATYVHSNSSSFPTRLQLTGGDAEPEEPHRYGLGNPRIIAPEDPGAEAASPGAVLLKTPTLTISVLAVPCRVSPAPGTSVANVTADCQQTTRTNKVQFLSSRQ